MKTHSRRRWLGYGLLCGAIVGAAAYGWTKTRGRSRARTEPAATERHATAFLLRRRIDPGQIEAVRKAARTSLERRNDEDDRNANRLLGLERAATASLFLDRGGEESSLAWYVEVPRSVLAAVDDPVGRLERAFPLEHEALGDELIVTREPPIHAAHPDRPRSTAPVPGTDGDAGRLIVTGSESTGAVESAGSTQKAESVDVALVSMKLRPGMGERLADWLEWLSRRVVVDDWHLGPIEDWSAEMLEREAMFTETIFVERRSDGTYLLQYMECAEMADVYEAYYDTWNPVARGAELLVGRVVEQPERVLQYPIQTDAECLAHAVASDRPRRLEEF
ncbi:DUF6176 family protein [Natrarchaeobaculum aegyptiacum]|uniref:Uncharacterized protein n=1 Tax=Natrarchaeobaculum aegyptiacum TaxID=745377 RepID=A0A2Z2HRH6_9EURY|nr:DUF6176 family protein [Natrarchaeobaculum aegyptiacum]ARS89760.1 hypothetical protein B1756_08405 [Natrarchaeobaculum aegyptiacum]